MAVLRKASSYSKKRVRPYTRTSKNKSKAYIKTVPHNKIVKYETGNKEAYTKGQHAFVVKYISNEKVQIRDNALEACRMFITKIIDREMPGQYYFAVKVFPHHILRQNKTVAAVAGADRLSSGMTHSFGSTIGRAAIVVPGKEIFLISCTNEKNARIARDTLAKIKSKIPCIGRIVFEKIK